MNYEIISINDEIMPLLGPEWRPKVPGAACETAIVHECPYCGKEHTHGWGTGVRMSHCISSERPYYLFCDAQ